MRIALIAKPGHSSTGVGRYTNELATALEMLGHQVSIIHPRVPFPSWFLRLANLLLRWDLMAFFTNYPIWIAYPKADVYHLTSQNLATLMFFHRPPGKSVVTIHDLIPWLTRDDPQLRTYRHHLDAFFDHLAMRSIARVDGIVADSEDTARYVDSSLNLPNQIPVHVAPLAIR